MQLNRHQALIFSEMFKSYFFMTAVIVSGIAIPISTALQNIGAALLIISFFIPLHFRSLSTSWNLPFPATGLLLGLALAIGTIWSSASLGTSWEFFWKLHAYYLAPIFIITLSPNKYRDYFLKSFGIGVIVSVLLSCVSAWFNQPILEATPDDWSIFRTHTYHNFFAAIVGSGILAALLTDSVPKRIKPLLIFSISIISYDILFLVAGRTGQIIYVLMIIMVLFHWKWKQGIIFSLLIIATLAIILPQYSSAYIQGMNNARADLNAFSQGNPNTSIGLRLVWHKYSLELIKEKPWLGHGTGSFKGEYKRIIESKNNSPTTENPHNDYLWLSVDLGIFGGLLLIGLLLSAAWQGRHLKPAWRWTLHSLLLGMGISTLANSFFTDNISGLGFVLLTCALLNGPTKTIEINA